MNPELPNDATADFGDMSRLDDETVDRHDLENSTVVSRHHETEPPPRTSLPSHFGRYAVVDRLGKGAYGDVFLGYDELTDRQIAIKVLRISESVGKDDARRNWLAEAQTLARFEHPGIIKVYDCGESDDGNCYMVTEYVDGGNLKQVMSSGQFDWNAAVSCIADIALALHEAHSHGIVHRDIKPANILLTQQGLPKVTDFGMALDDQDVSLDPSLAGTFSYLSPEQAGMRSQAVDGRSDIFSLGIVFYEMLTGHRPFIGHGPPEILRHIQELDPRPPRQWNDAIPADVESVCLTALQKSPAKRFSTAKDFSQALRRCLPGEDHRRRRRSVGWLAAAVVIGLFTAGIIWWNQPSHVAAEPAIADVELVHYDRSGSTPRRVGSLTSGSSEPVLFGDSVKLNATFSRPVYPYLFTLDTNGVVTQRFPSGAPTSPLKSLTYPDAPAAVYTLSDGAGTQAILLLTFDEIPRRDQIGEVLSANWRNSRSEGNWAYTEKSLQLLTAGNHSSRGTEDLLVTAVPIVFESVCRIAAEQSGVVDCYGIAFPVIDRK